jgi:hypothetical protein
MVAVCTIATMKVDVVRDVMSHDTATSRIQVPTRETTLAIQRLRKKGSDRGLQVEGGLFSSGGIEGNRFIHIFHFSVYQRIDFFQSSVKGGTHAPWGARSGQAPAERA